MYYIMILVLMNIFCLQAAIKKEPSELEIFLKRVPYDLLPSLVPQSLLTEKYAEKTREKTAPFNVEYHKRLFGSPSQHLIFHGTPVTKLIKDFGKTEFGTNFYDFSQKRRDRVVILGPNRTGLCVLMSKFFFLDSEIRPPNKKVKLYDERPIDTRFRGNHFVGMLQSARKCTMHIISHDDGKIKTTERKFDSCIKDSIKRLIAIHPSKNLFCHINNNNTLEVAQEDASGTWRVVSLPVSLKNLGLATKSIFLNNSKVLISTPPSSRSSSTLENFNFFLVPYATEDAVVKTVGLKDIFHKVNIKLPENVDIEVHNFFSSYNLGRIFIEIHMQKKDAQKEEEFLSYLIEANGGFTHFDLIDTSRSKILKGDGKTTDYSGISDYYFADEMPLRYDNAHTKKKGDPFYHGALKETYKIISDIFKWNPTRLSGQQNDALRGALFYSFAWSDDGNKDLVDEATQWIINGENDVQKGTEILDQLKTKKPVDKYRLFYRTDKLFGTLYKLVKKEESNG